MFGRKIVSDPRLPGKVKILSISTEEPIGDWLSFLSLICGVVGLMFKNKLCAWISIFSSVASVSNARWPEVDTKQMLCSITFAVMGLVMNYLQSEAGGGSLFASS